MKRNKIIFLLGLIILCMSSCGKEDKKIIEPTIGEIPFAEMSAADAEQLIVSQMSRYEKELLESDAYMNQNLIPLLNAVDKYEVSVPILSLGDNNEIRMHRTSIHRFEYKGSHSLPPDHTESLGVEFTWNPSLRGYDKKCVDNGYVMTYHFPSTYDEQKNVYTMQADLHHYGKKLTSNIRFKMRDTTLMNIESQQEEVDDENIENMKDHTLILESVTFGAYSSVYYETTNKLWSEQESAWIEVWNECSKLSNSDGVFYGYQDLKTISGRLISQLYRGDLIFHIQIERYEELISMLMDIEDLYEMDSDQKIKLMNEILDEADYRGYLEYEERRLADIRLHADRNGDFNYICTLKDGRELRIIDEIL